MRKLCLLLSLSATAPTTAGQPPPLLAHRLALADMNRKPEQGTALNPWVPPALWPVTRYIWNPSADPENVKAMAFALNTISRTDTLKRPVAVAGGLLIRLNILDYAARERDIREWSETWEELHFDPCFSLLITRDTIDLLEFPDGEAPRVKRRVKRVKEILVDVPAYVHEGRTWTQKRKDVEVIETVETSVLDLTKDDDFQVVRIEGTHLDARAVAALQLQTGSQAPVVSLGYFTSRALSQIQDQGVFKEVYGGLYYRFRGFRRAKKGDKFTDEDLLFEDLGIGNIKAGDTAEKFFDRLRSDRRGVILRSAITKKMRRWDLYPLSNYRDGQGVFGLTHDVGDGDIDVGQSAIKNLVLVRDRAREGIFTLPNGLHGFVLINSADGSFANEVPPDVAHDNKIPAGFTQRLQPAIGCIRCHGAHDGWQPLKNDVLTLLAGYQDGFGNRRRLDIFADTTKKDEPIPGTLARLAGQYAGRADKQLMRGRDDYAEAVMRCTGPWKQGGDQTDVAKRVSAKISDIWAAYNWDEVNAGRALLEMGVEFQPGKQLETLRAVLAPSKDSRIGNITPEDTTIGSLLAGLEVGRREWDLAFSFAATRALKNLAQQKEKAQP